MEYTWWFDKTYLIKVDHFLGSFDKLRPLQNYKKQAMMRNHHASLHSHKIQNDRSKEKNPKSERFNELLSDWETVRKELVHLHANQEERDAAFEIHPDVDAILSEMGAIVVSVREEQKNLVCGSRKEVELGNGNMVV